MIAAAKAVIVLAALSSFPATFAQIRPLKGLTEPDEPANPQPAATDFRDPKYKLSFQIPAGWNVERQDGVLSTFKSEVHTAPRGLQLRGVAALNYNPYPPTTFAGAIFYYSVQPNSSAAACTAQTTQPPFKPQQDAVIAGRPFHHGEEHHGTICTEARDEVFTTLRGTTCLRFDLVINTFCHASSGAIEIGPTQLNDISTRMTNILNTLQLY